MLGRKRFSAIRKAVRAARRKDTTAALEAKCLEDVRVLAQVGGGNQKSARTAPDYEDDPDGYVSFGEEADDDDATEMEEVELEEFEEGYLPVPTKKAKK